MKFNLKLRRCRRSRSTRSAAALCAFAQRERGSAMVCVVFLGFMHACFVGSARITWPSVESVRMVPWVAPTRQQLPLPWLTSATPPVQVPLLRAPQSALQRLRCCWERPQCRVPAPPAPRLCSLCAGIAAAAAPTVLRAVAPPPRAVRARGAPLAPPALRRTLASSSVAPNSLRTPLRTAPASRPRPSRCYCWSRAPSTLRSRPALRL